MSNFENPITLQEYFTNPTLLTFNYTELVKHNGTNEIYVTARRNQKDFIDKFILDLENEEKIVNTLSHETCLKIIEINFYHQVIYIESNSKPHSARKYSKYSDMPIENQKYHQKIKKALFAIFIQYILSIPSQDFDYNSMILLANNVKDRFIPRNIFILELLLELSFISIQNESVDLNIKIMHFFKNIQKNLGIIDHYHLQATMDDYIPIEMSTSNYSLLEGDEIYNIPTLENLPPVNIPTNYNYKYVEPRNATLTHIMKSTTNIKLNVRPTLKYNLLTDLYFHFLLPIHSEVLTIQNINYKRLNKNYVTRILNDFAINAGGPSRSFYNDLSIHFTNSVQMKKIRNLNERGVPKKIIGTTRDHIKDIIYVPYIEKFFSDASKEIFKPINNRTNEVVNINSNIQLILNIMFFTVICAGAHIRQNIISHFTIKESYLSRIFTCYLIESIMNIYDIPSLNKNIFKYILYSLLTAENSEDGFNTFRRQMASLYCAIHELTENDYYNGTVDEIILDNQKIFQHFINQNMKVEDLSNILNIYYFNKNISTLRSKDKKIMNTYFIHRFMLNHVISKEISASIEDKNYIKRPSQLQIMITTHNNIMREDKLRNIINNFIDSLNDQEMKIFITCVTGSSSIPNKLIFAFNHGYTNNIQLAYHFGTCFNKFDIGYNFVRESPRTIPIAPYNSMETIVYNMLITNKEATINIMKGTLAGGGFQVA